MRKTPAYVSMFLIVLGLAAGDGWLLTRAEGRRLLVEGRLRDLFGEQLSWGNADISIDGTVTLEETRFTTPRGLQALASDHVEIRMGFSGLEQVRLEGFRGTLTQALIEELVELRGPERPVRELFPNPDRTPALRALKGRLEVRLPAVFAGDVLQTLEVHELRAVPLGGYRYAVLAEVGHAVYGAWSLRGELDLEKGTQRLRAEGRGLRVTRGWRDPLVPGFREIYDHYRPEGLCDVVVELARSGREAPLDVKVTLLARDLRMVYSEFPYPMEGVHGEIEFTGAGFSIKEMRGRHAGRLAKFDGEAGGYSHGDPMDFRFEMDGLPLDAAILQALPPATRAAVAQFSPKGAANVRGRVLRQRGRREQIPLEIFLVDADLTYAGFPYPLRHAEGLIQVDGEEVRVRGVTARDGATVMSCSGTIRHLSGDPEIDLRIEAERLPLDARLKAAIGPEGRALWDRFEPTGEVDVVWHARKLPGKEVVHDSRTRCLGNRARYKDLPLPVTDLRGEVFMEGGKFRLNHLIGKVKGGEVELHGGIEGDALSLHVDGTGLPMDDELKAALPPELSDILRSLNITGTASFNAGLIFKKDVRQVDLVCRLSKGSIGTDIRLEDVEGTVTLTGYAGADSQYIGFMNFSHALLWGKRLTDLGASFNLRGNALSFSNLKGTAYGGMLSGKSYLVDLKSKDYFAEELVLDGLDLREYSRETKYPLGGKVRLELPLLKGNTRDAGTAAGKGRMVIRDAQLWEIPVFIQFFTLNPGELLKEKRKFDAGALDFDIKERRFDISRLAFTSESVSMVGDGKINFDGSLHVTLRPKSGPLLGIDFFILKWAGDLMSLVLGSSVKVVVTGTFDKPEVHVR